MFKYIFLTVFLMFSCSSSGDTTNSFISSDKDNDFSHIRVDFVNYPSSKTYTVNDTIIFDLIYNLSIDDYDTSYNYIEVWTSVKEFNTISQSSFICEDSLMQKFRLKNKNDILRIKQPVWSLEGDTDSIQYIYAIQISLLTLSKKISYRVDLYNPYKNQFYKP